MISDFNSLSLKIQSYRSQTMTSRLNAILISAFTYSGLATVPASAANFKTGPVIEAFGNVSEVDGRTNIPADAIFKVAFDISGAADEGKLNRRFETAARFLNMHGRAGVPEDNMDLALVIHGGASKDLLNSEDNPNAPLIAELVKHNVKVILCGQTAAYRNITPEDLLPGVTISLSAMTAHALLQQDGYTLNPF